VKDIHANLEISVYDENKNRPASFLGRVTLPLLRIADGWIPRSGGQR
jgi:Ca2+-dependent lipid-binding protein